MFFLEKVYKGCNNCSVHLLTPLRIRRKGNLTTDVESSMLVRNIIRRLIELTGRYGDFVDREASEEACRKADSIIKNASGISVEKLERFSSRQEKKMDLSGLLGAMTFSGDLEIFTPGLDAPDFFTLGETLHLDVEK